MATQGRQQSARLIDRLLANPQAFEVFAAVRLIEEEAARRATARGDEPPPEVGAQDAAAGSGDPVRFRAAVTLGFPGAAVVAAREIAPPRGPTQKGQAPSAAVELDIASFGLIGPSGVLPRHYTALVSERMRKFRDHALRDFLDIFMHRAMSLLVRAWGKYRPAVQRSRLTSRGQGAAWDQAAPRDHVAGLAGSDGIGPRDSLTAVLASLVGIGGRTFSGRMRFDDSLACHYAGHLARQSAAALPLEQLLADAWGVRVQIEQFVGRWLALEPADQTRLGGKSGRTGGNALGSNAVLGVDAIAGSRVWSVESAFCVRLGPLTLTEFRRWLPGGRCLGGMSDLLRFHVGPHLEATVRPMLLASEVPPARLGGQDREPDGSPGGSRLGWTSWLVSRCPVFDADDASFNVAP